MNRVCSFVIAALLATSLFVGYTDLSQADDTVKAASGEAKVLFNGKDLAGWSGDTRLWSVRDGVIHGETTEQNAAQGNTFLIWQGGTVKNFELEVTFRCNATNNSGIQYRSKHINDGSGKNDAPNANVPLLIFGSARHAVMSLPQLVQDGVF